MRRGSGAAGGLVFAGVMLAGSASLAATPSRDDARIVHVLNRLAYGPRPGDVEALRAIGVATWIDRQLHPQTIDDATLAARLAPLPTLKLTSRELLSRFDLPRGAKRDVQRLRAELGDAESDADFRRARREIASKYGSRMDGPPRQVVEELQAAKLLRAVYSERQLDEVLVDFWMNHFNVYARKGPVKFLLGAYEQDVIRRHAWGRFEDLLRATAENPAMLFYLDNWLSADPEAAARLAVFMEQRGARGRAGRRASSTTSERAAGAAAEPREPLLRRRGLNENYARELMELHTLGVDGGYTQTDVTELARVFTGWTIRRLRQGDPEFAFEERLHDRGRKVVLGHVFEGGGKREGDAALRMLAEHPATARFISYKLAQRFVGDAPPVGLVERAAATFRATRGEIRAVVATIVKSPEFLAVARHGTKVKTPLEFVASALRASRADLRDARAVNGRLEQMGMPLYMQQPPTGYKDTAEAWVSTSGLLARLNFALDLTGDRLPGVRVDLGRLVPDIPSGATLVARIASQLVPGGLSESTQLAIHEEGSGIDSVRVAGLILGSPEFQRR